MNATDEDAIETLRLPAALDLAAAEELLATLRQRLESGGALRLDAGEVEVLTLPCMQVIVAAARTNERVSVANPSDEFVRAFEDLAITWPRAPDDGNEHACAGDDSGAAPDLPQELTDDIALAPSLDAAQVQEPSEESISGSTDAALQAPMSEEAILGSTDPWVQAPAGFAGTDDEPGESIAAPSDDDITVCNEPGYGDGAVAAPAPDQDAAQGPDDIRDEFVDQVQTDEADVPKKILTIDDSKTMRDMLRITLTDAGFDVLQGVDGQNGLDVLGQQRVDAVITDINMPVMDGYEVIRQLRRSPMHKATPILVLTTESDLEKKKLARDAGATGWMVKPFDPDRLIATIRKVAP